MMHRFKVLAVVALTAAPALAHDGVVHKTPEEAARHLAETSKGAPPLPDTVFPINLGGAFTLTDQTGALRTEADPEGRYQLLFFGYANCEAICSVALPMMGTATDALAKAGTPVRPVMVTVDPKRDTVETIGAPLAEHHPDFVGLTGAPEDLQQVYDLFSVEHAVAFVDPELGEIFSHGSFIYLLDGTGTFVTLLPPILSTERIVEIVAGYAGN